MVLPPPVNADLLCFQFSIKYADTNDNQLGSGDRSETFVGMSLAQVVILAVLVFLVRKSFGGVQHDQTSTRSRVVTAHFIAVFVISLGLYIARLGIAGSLIENQFECTALSQEDCFKFNSETTVVTPALIGFTNFTCLFGIGSVIVLVWLHLQKWTITTELISSSIHYPTIFLNVLCFAFVIKQVCLGTNLDPVSF